MPEMTPKTDRLILAIFSAQEDEPEKAYQSLRSLRDTRVGFLGQDGSVKGSGRLLRRFTGLQLEGESIVTAKCSDADLPVTVKHLQAAGSPSIFVFRPELGRGRRTLLDQRKAAASQSGLLARVSENEQILDAARADLMEATRLNHALTPAAEWILDNGYLIHMQVAEVRRHIPRGYPKGLPVADRGTRHPRVYDIAHKLVVRRDFAIDDESLKHHLAEFQKETVLTVAELWLFPLLLRVALVEELTNLALHVHGAQQLRELAYLWANRLAAAVHRDESTFERMLALLENEPFAIQPYFVVSLAEQLHGEEAALAPVQRWVEQRLQTPFRDLVRQEHQREAAERLSVANAFGSLRAISRIDFTEIFEASSRVETELRKDPVGVYGSSDFMTRDMCRRAVERTARRAGIAEVEVAR